MEFCLQLWAVWSQYMTQVLSNVLLHLCIFFSRQQVGRPLINNQLFALGAFKCFEPAQQPVAVNFNVGCGVVPCRLLSLPMYVAVIEPQREYYQGTSCYADSKGI